MATRYLLKDDFEALKALARNGEHARISDDAARRLADAGLVQRHAGGWAPTPEGRRLAAPRKPERRAGTDVR